MGTCCLGLRGGAASERRELPPGMEGVYARLGPPWLGIYLMQTDPPSTDATLGEHIAHQKRVLHEVRHAYERERDQLRMLVAQKKNASSTPRKNPKIQLS